MDRWFDVYASPLGEPGSGKFALVFQDITERKLTDAKIRESEALLQKAFSTDAVGVIFFNLTGGISQANEAFVRMTGFEREELLGVAHWDNLTAPGFSEIAARSAENLAATGETAPYEKQMIRKDGSLWWGLFAPTRINGSGSESECVEFVIDITESKRAEAALRESDMQIASRRRSRRDGNLGLESANGRGALERAALSLIRLGAGRRMGYLRGF